MNQALNVQPRVAIWPRYVVGGLVTLLSVAALVWTGLLLSVEYRFRVIPPPERSAREKQFLNQYSLQLDHLLALDPSNGEMRNMYASVLAKLADYEGAVQHMQIAMRTHNTQNSQFFLADMYEKMGDTNRAEAAMAECLKINPVDTQFNPAHLRLLNKRLLDMKALKAKNAPTFNADAYIAARREYGEATLNWAIRAPHDQNAHLFLGNSYIEPLYALQAYRCYLLGLSQARSMNLNSQLMIQPQAVLGTVGQILNGHYAKRYRNLP